MSMNKKYPDNYGSEGDDGSDSDAEQRNEEPSYEPRPLVAAPFASSIGLPLADTSDDDQKPAAKEYASFGGMVSAAATTTATTHSSSSTPPSPQEGQRASKKRRNHEENEYRFSFREPFLEKVSCKIIQ